MYTKGDLIEEFDKQCRNIATTLETIIFENTPNNEDALIIDVLENEIPGIGLWWDDRNKADYSLQIEHLRVNYPERYNDLLDEAGVQLEKNPRHLAYLEKMTKDSADPELISRLVPHTVGEDGQKYGHELRETDGYRALDFLCKSAELTCEIKLTTNPNIDDLTQAFRLCIEISAIKGTPLKYAIALARLTPSKGMH